MRYSLMLALMILPDVAFAATPEPEAPACYTQRTRPDNVVLPKARAADTMELPALHLPDASVRNEPVTIVLDLHVSAAGKVDHAILQEGSSVAAWNAGVLKNAPNKTAAVLYLEYLASNAAQSYFASGNNEWPAVTGAPLNNPTLEAMGKFKADALNVAALGKHQPTAQKVFDHAGFK